MLNEEKLNPISYADNILVYFMINLMYYNDDGITKRYDPHTSQLLNVNVDESETEKSYILNYRITAVGGTELSSNIDNENKIIHVVSQFGAAHNNSHVAEGSLELYKEFHTKEQFNEYVTAINGLYDRINNLLG